MRTRRIRAGAAMAVATVVALTGMASPAMAGDSNGRDRMGNADRDGRRGDDRRDRDRRDRDHRDRDRDGSRNTIDVRLSGYEETPLAISTTGTGRFRAKIDERDETITWELSYANLESAVTQAHIHFGAESQSGGISAFLCSNLAGRPAGTQQCPAQPATITGEIMPEDVVGPPEQGIAPGEFDELVAAIRNGAAYVNVHSVRYPSGEIRGQLPG